MWTTTRIEVGDNKIDINVTKMCRRGQEMYTEAFNQQKAAN